MIESDKKILVISESEPRRSFINETLAEAYRLILTDSFAQGLDVLKNDLTIRAVICHCDPDDQSLTALANDLQENTPSIALLVIPKSPTPAGALKQGVSECLSYPLKPQDLLSSVQSHLE